MALKRLDEEFELKPGTQLLPYMKRLLPSLENRFQSLEAADDALERTAQEIKEAALLRMNEILIPATEDIIAVTKLGFLLAPITEMLYTMQLGYMAVYIDVGPQANTFTPSPYVIIEGIDNVNNYCLARTIAYDQKTRIFEMDVTAVHGDPSAQPWMVTCSPGMAQSSKDYHDLIAPMYETVVTDHAEVVFLHTEIMRAAQELLESGLDLYNYVKNDGTTPFFTVQPGVTPEPTSNDHMLATTSWARARAQEYAATAVKKTGDTMSGPLTLSGPPSNPQHAATKSYIDDLLGGAGGALTITQANPTIRLKVTGSQQDRLLEGLNPSGAQRWSLVLGDSVAEAGGNAGSNFSLRRFSDAGTLIDTSLYVERSSGKLTTKAVQANGNLAVYGDIYTWRPGAENTGVVFLNQSGSAYHHFDGASHSFVGGSMAVHGGVSMHHLNCYSISTQGHYTTTWGMTSHGDTRTWGTAHMSSIYVDSPGPIINMYDNDWGPMYIHHQSDLIGFLNNGGGWIMYVRNDGHMWMGAYGWLHDYVNGRANAYAWEAANYRYNQCVTAVRFAHLGDVQHYFNQLQEPWGGGVITGMTGAWASYYVTGRYRQCHILIAGGWHAATY